jgi:hypothetical protein
VYASKDNANCHSSAPCACSWSTPSYAHIQKKATSTAKRTCSSSAPCTYTGSIPSYTRTCPATHPHRPTPKQGQAHLQFQRALRLLHLAQLRPQLRHVAAGLRHGSGIQRAALGDGSEDPLQPLQPASTARTWGVIRRGKRRAQRAWAFQACVHVGKERRNIHFLGLQRRAGHDVTRRIILQSSCTTAMKHALPPTARLPPPDRRCHL